jgi:hypothetical protein
VGLLSTLAEAHVSDQETKSEDHQPDQFVPRGAMAFMVLMILAYGLIWFFFYFLMIGRP